MFFFIVLAHSLATRQLGAKTNLLHFHHFILLSGLRRRGQNELLKLRKGSKGAIRTLTLSTASPAFYL